MRVVFFGTPDFAVPTLRHLAQGPHRVVGVVSQPDRAKGRGRKLAPSPVSAVALEAGLPLLRAEKVSAPEVAGELADLRPDAGVVAAFGQFLPRRLRQLPALGYLINAHASLLPRHRGAAPVAHAILAGDRETGISVMRVEREMDAGPVATRHATPIGDDECAGELEARLAVIAASAIAQALDEIAAGRIRFAEQDPNAATLAPKIGRDDAALEPGEGAAALVRRVRAMSPRPGAFLMRGGEPLRILAARAHPEACDLSPGTARIQGTDVRIATGDGWLLPLRMQRPGGRALDTADFQRGRGLADGELLVAAHP